MPHAPFFYKEACAAFARIINPAAKLSRLVPFDVDEDHRGDCQGQTRIEGLCSGVTHDTQSRVRCARHRLDVFAFRYIPEPPPLISPSSVLCPLSSPFLSSAPSLPMERRFALCALLDRPWSRRAGSQSSRADTSSSQETTNSWLPR